MRPGEDGLGQCDGTSSTLEKPIGSHGNTRITGKLDLNVPPYLKLDHDSTARRLVLSIEDNKVKQQMEMWGTATSFPPPKPSQCVRTDKGY